MPSWFHLHVYLLFLKQRLLLCMSELYSHLSGNMSLRNFVILFLLCCFDSDKFSQFFFFKSENVFILPLYMKSIVIR